MPGTAPVARAAAASITQLPDTAAHVARQPRVRHRMNVPGAHPITRLEPRWRGRRAPELAAHHDALDIGEGELAALERLRRLHRMSGGNVLGGDETLGDQHI